MKFFVYVVKLVKSLNVRSTYSSTLAKFFNNLPKSIIKGERFLMLLKRKVRTAMHNLHR